MAGIQGLDAWSLNRDAQQVFDWLERVYAALDDAARRRPTVSIVDTPGDTFIGKYSVLARLLQYWW